MSGPGRGEQKLTLAVLSMEEQLLCFVCRSNIHQKYSEETEAQKVLTDCNCDTITQEGCHVKTETDYANIIGNQRAGDFCGCSLEKFRKIQNTLFNFVLRVSPSISTDDDLTETRPAKLCDNCETDIYRVCQTNLEIKKLQNDLDRLSNNILDSVISSVIECYFSENNVDNHRKLNSELEENNVDFLNKLIPKESIGRRVYKQWKARFCEAFRTKLKTETAPSTIEPDIEHYVVEVVSSEVNLEQYCVVKSEFYDGFHSEVTIDADEVVCHHHQSQNEETSDANIIRMESSNLEHGFSENLEELKIVNSKCVPKKRMKQLDEAESPNFKSLAIEKWDPEQATKIEDPMCHKYQCSECGQSCKRETRLKEHMKIYHSQEVRETGMYQCPECLTCFIRYQHLKFHVSSAHKDIECGFEWCKLCKIMIRKTVDHACKTFCKKCPVCENDFNSINSYRLHRKEICLVKRHGERGSKYFSCDVCPKSFNRKQGLIYHKKTHTGEKNFICGACDKMFTSKNQLQVHERIHSGEKPYVCDMCGLTFSSTPGLVSHKKTHLGVKPYTCDTCSKSFRSLGHLNTHQIIHTGEKPFSCTICQKSFNRKENLRSHEYTHAINKPHKCSICPSTSFARASLLRNHIKSRHSKKTTLPAKSSSVIAQQPPHIVLTRVGDCKEMKTQLRIIKGSNQSMPYCGQGQKPPEPPKNVAYLVAGNPGKYIVLKNVAASSQVGNTRQDSLQPN